MSPEGDAAGAVLLVEDDPATANLERRSLARAGRRVRIVGLVREALEAMGKEDFAVILVDYRLPDGEPWPVLEAAQRARPPIPTILLTAMGDERIPEEFLNRGGAGYLIKTQSFWDQLDGVIERTLKTARAAKPNGRPAVGTESSDDPTGK